MEIKEHEVVNIIDKMKSVPPQKRLIWILDNVSSFEASVEEKLELIDTFTRIFRMIDEERRIQLN
jgi:hypothetical protein